MKKLIKSPYLFLLLFVILLPLNNSQAANLATRLRGRILLQVQSHGEAWYVDPGNSQRYYLGNGNDAYKIMSKLSLGISNANLDRVKHDAKYRSKFIGKILLQVQSHGEAYYISPDDRYNYLKNGTAAFAIMRKYGLGITNSNLAKIPVSSIPGLNMDKTHTVAKELTIAENCNALPDKLATCTKYKCQFIHPFTGQKMIKEIKGIVNGKCDYTEQMPMNTTMKCDYNVSERKVASQYYKSMETKKSSNTNVHVVLGAEKTQVTYTVDGKKVDNPLQTFLNNNVCTFSNTLSSNSNSNSTKTPTLDPKSMTQQYKNETFSQLLNKNESLECTIPKENAKATGTIYIGNGMLRSNLSSIDKTQHTDEIIKNNTIYAWDPTGEGMTFKMPLSEIDSGTSAIYEMKNNYSCKHWDPNDTIFALPNLNFIYIDQILGQAAESQYLTISPNESLRQIFSGEAVECNISNNSQAPEKIIKASIYGKNGKIRGNYYITTETKTTVSVYKKYMMYKDNTLYEWDHNSSQKMSINPSQFDKISPIFYTPGIISDLKCQKDYPWRSFLLPSGISTPKTVSKFTVF